MMYKATLSAFTKAITYLLLVVMFSWLFFVIYVVYTHIPNTTPFGVIGVVILAFTVAITFMYMPTGYQITPTQLIINRRASSLHINLSDITACSNASGIPMLRLFGSGGLFGYLGLYYSSSVGRVWLYCTRRNKLVLVNTSNSLPLMLSPDEDVLFINDLKSKLS